MSLTQIISAYTERINETPFLISVLYDLNLLPEQIEDMQSAKLMAAITDIYYKGFEDGVQFITKVRYLE